MRLDPAVPSAGALDPVDQVIVRARADRILERADDARRVVGVDHGAHRGVRQRPRRQTVDGIRRRRCGQREVGQRQLPHRDASDLGREAQPLLAQVLRIAPVGDLDSQARLVALEARQPLTFHRHVDLARKKIGDVAAFVEDWRDQQPVPEHLAATPIVAQVDLDRTPRVDRRPHPGDLRRIGRGPLQEAAITADELARRIAGQTAEAVVDEDDRIVGQARIGDAHRHPGCANGGDERVGADVGPADFGKDARRVGGHRQSIVV